MKAYEIREGMYTFKYLPAYTQFLIDNHLEEFAREQLELSYNYRIPLLKYLDQLTEEEKVALSKQSSETLLSALAKNKAKERLEASIQTWANDQLKVLGKFDLVAEDITLVNHVRQKGLKNWLLRYTKDPEIIIELTSEIADFTFGSNTTSTNFYIKILTEEIEKKRRQLLEAQEITQTGSFVWDFVNVSNEHSPQLRKIFETEEAQSFEQLLKRVHGDDREKVKSSVGQSLIDGIYDCEFRYLINNKEKVLWARAVVHFEEGHPKLMVGTVQDITERKKIEQHLLQKTYELELTNAKLQEFAFVASHDLQEPLRKTLLHADRLVKLEKDRLSEKGKELLEKISTSTTKMKTLISDILTYSTTNAEPVKEKAILEDILYEVKSELDNLINKKDATIITNTLPEATVYPSQINQLFKNLIANSLKFSKPDIPPVIIITHKFLEPNALTGYKIKPASKYLELKLSDNGIGFRKEHAENIFQLFKRLHTQTEFEGSGLGLAICRKVVENHGGVIHASGEPGVGATFCIILPQ